MTFLYIGVIGLAWIIPWLIINKNTPDKHPWITYEEQVHILDEANRQKDTITSTKVYTWRELLRFGNTWSIISSRFFHRSHLVDVCNLAAHIPQRTFFI